jgi:hypothetical protein
MPWCSRRRRGRRKVRGGVRYKAIPDVITSTGRPGKRRKYHPRISPDGIFESRAGLPSSSYAWAIPLKQIETDGFSSRMLKWGNVDCQNLHGKFDRTPTPEVSGDFSCRTWDRTLRHHYHVCCVIIRISRRTRGSGKHIWAWQYLRFACIYLFYHKLHYRVMRLKSHLEYSAAVK